MGSFLVWISLGAVMGVIILGLVYTGENTILQMLWQCLWSGSVGFFGSAFMFWQISKENAIQITIPQNNTKTSAEHWRKVYDAF
jgi:hypothetical protein